MITTEAPAAPATVAPTVRRGADVGFWAFLAAGVGLLLATFVLRLRTFAPLEVGIDGALSMDLARSPLSELFAFNALDVHPPLFYATLKVWFLLIGASYYTAKYLVILCSLLAVALIIALGRRLLAPGAGLLAGALLLLTPTAVLLGPAVRDYTPGLALSLLTLLLVVQAVDQARHIPRSRIPAMALPVALAFATAAALLTWYFHVVILALGAGLILWRGAGRRPRLLAALAAGIVLASPWYLYAAPLLLGKVASGTTGYGGTPHAPSLAALIPPLERGLVGLNSPGVPAAAGMLLWTALIVLGALTLTPAVGRVRSGKALPPYPPRSRAGVRVLLAGLLLAAAFVYLVVARWYLPADVGRYALVLVPFAALLQAAGALHRTGVVRMAALAGVVVLLVLQGASFVRLVTSPPIDWAHDPAVAQVRANMRPGDSVLFSDRARHLRFDLTPHPGVVVGVVHSAGQRYLQADLQQETDRVLGSILPSAHRVWYLESAEPPGTPPVLRSALTLRAYPAQRQNVDGTDVQLYLTGTPTNQTAPDVTFSTLARLTSARFTDQAQPGGGLLLDLTWQCVTPSATTYTVFVHLDDANGKTVAQHDGQPQDGLAPTTSWKAGQTIDDHHGVLLPSTLAPGRYHLYVGLYNGPTRLVLPDGTNQYLVGTVSLR